MTLQRTKAHSALVRMTLKVGGQSVGVAQMGPDFLVLKEAVESDATLGVVTLSVDGVTEDIPVLLPNGISQESKRVEIAEVESGALVAA